MAPLSNPTTDSFREFGHTRMRSEELKVSMNPSDSFPEPRPPNVHLSSTNELERTRPRPSEPKEPKLSSDQPLDPPNKAHFNTFPRTRSEAPRDVEHITDSLKPPGILSKETVNTRVRFEEKEKPPSSSIRPPERPPSVQPQLIRHDFYTSNTESRNPRVGQNSYSDSANPHYSLPQHAIIPPMSIPAPAPVKATASTADYAARYNNDAPPTEPHNAPPSSQRASRDRDSTVHFAISTSAADSRLLHPSHAGAEPNVPSSAERRPQDGFQQTARPPAPQINGYLEVPEEESRRIVSAFIYVPTSNFISGQVWGQRDAAPKQPSPKKVVQPLETPVPFGTSIQRPPTANGHREASSKGVPSRSYLPAAATSGPHEADAPQATHLDSQHRQKIQESQHYNETQAISKRGPDNQFDRNQGAPAFSTGGGFNSTTGENQSRMRVATAQESIGLSIERPPTSSGFRGGNSNMAHQLQFQNVPIAKVASVAPIEVEPTQASLGQGLSHGAWGRHPVENEGSPSMSSRLKTQSLPHPATRTTEESAPSKFNRGAPKQDLHSHGIRSSAPFPLQESPKLSSHGSSDVHIAPHMGNNHIPSHVPNHQSDSPLARERRISARNGAIADVVNLQPSLASGNHKQESPRTNYRTAPTPVLPHGQLPVIENASYRPVRMSKEESPRFRVDGHVHAASARPLVASHDHDEREGALHSSSKNNSPNSITRGHIILPSKLEPVAPPPNHAAVPQMRIARPASAMGNKRDAEPLARSLAPPQTFPSSGSPAKPLIPVSTETAAHRPVESRFIVLKL